MYAAHTVWNNLDLEITFLNNQDVPLSESLCRLILCVLLLIMYLCQL